MAAEAVQQQGAAAILTAMESCMIVESREFPLLASALGRSISVRVFMQVNWMELAPPSSASMPRRVNSWVPGPTKWKEASSAPMVKVLTTMMFR